MNTKTNPPLTLETYEDRPAAWIGLKLLSLSLQRSSPEVRLRVWGLPTGAPITGWMARRPGVVLREEVPMSLGGWDVKPWILGRVLREGASQAVWIDGDIIVNGDLNQLLDTVPTSCFLATEEPLHSEEVQGSGPRLGALGLTPGRPILRTVNSCFVRAKSEHLRLLDTWQTSMQDERYREAQRKPFLERPLGCRGDQDVLTGLLGSREFQDTAFHLLREGSEIAQCMHTLGFRTLARIRATFRGLPPLIHAQGEKPWDDNVSVSTQLSPYARLAADLASLVPEEPMEWTQPRSQVARLLDVMFLRHHSLRGLPLTMVREFHQVMRWRET